MARAARRSSQEDEEYEELDAILHSDKKVLYLLVKIPCKNLVLLLFEDNVYSISNS